MKKFPKEINRIAKIRPIVLAQMLLLGYFLGILGWAGLSKKAIADVFLQNQWSVQLTVCLLIMLSFVVCGAVRYLGSKKNEAYLIKRLYLLISISGAAVIIALVPPIFLNNTYFNFIGNFWQVPWSAQLAIWAVLVGLISMWFYNLDFKIKNPKKVFYLVMAAYFLLYAFQGLWMYREFRLPACDFGIYDQTLWQMSHNWSLVNTLNNFGHAFGAHFQPILLLLSPFYWLWNDARMLVLLEVGIVTLGAIPVFRLAQRNVKNHFFSLALVFAYLFFVGNRGALGFSFHPSTFVAPMLLFAYDYFDQKKWLLHGIFVVLALMTKENASNYIVMFGLFLIVFDRKYWKIGLLYIFAGILWLGVVTKILIPSFNGGDYGFFYYEALGKDQASGLITLVRNPLYVIKTMFDNPVKVGTFLSLTLGSGFLVFLSPYFLFMVPGLVEQLTSSRPAMWGADVYYGAPLAFGFVIATLYGAVRLKKFTWFKQNDKILMNMAALIIVLSTLGIFKEYRSIMVNRSENGSKAERWRLVSFPDKANFYEALKILPPRAKVSGQSPLVPHFSHRPAVYRFPYVYDANYIFLAADFTTWPLDRQQYQDKVSSLLNDRNWGVVFSKGGILLLQKGMSDKVAPSRELTEFLQGK